MIENHIMTEIHANSLKPTSSAAISENDPVDRLKLLYPNVNEKETPLPRSWNCHDRSHGIVLSHDNLRAQYKGARKSHSSAASVRTTYPIPASCGLFYFEVKIIFKSSKIGYMGIGLTSQNFRMNRLPGWDKQSYGYNGDDGNLFCSAGNGQPYGPTFSTGDIIGCGINLVNNTCFYTKNGLDLGIAFKNLSSKLYPTVGLQTPGEIIDANFGQKPFKFDQIEDMIKQMRAETKLAIHNFPVPKEQGDPTMLIHKLISSYLVHHVHVETAEIFAKATGQHFTEEISSIRNRKKILNLIMLGRMSQAIEHVLKSYPGVLENNKNLMFTLKCQQFIEMVNGSDLEDSTEISSIQESQKNSNNSDDNKSIIISGDIEMKAIKNDLNHDDSKQETINSNHQIKDTDEAMDVDINPSSRDFNHDFNRILQFGRDLSRMADQLEKENKMSESDRELLANAFSLIAYTNPHTSPLAWMLCPSKREAICKELNSAILVSMNYSWKPPLEICVAHSHELIKLMATSSLGSCAFVEDIFTNI